MIKAMKLFAIYLLSLVWLFSSCTDISEYQGIYFGVKPDPEGPWTIPVFLIIERDKLQFEDRYYKYHLTEENPQEIILEAVSNLEVEPVKLQLTYNKTKKKFYMPPSDLREEITFERLDSILAN